MRSTVPILKKSVKMQVNVFLVKKNTVFSVMPTLCEEAHLRHFIIST